jgi:hypothetical protein
MPSQMQSGSGLPQCGHSVTFSASAWFRLTSDMLGYYAARRQGSTGARTPVARAAAGTFRKRASGQNDADDEHAGGRIYPLGRAWRHLLHTQRFFAKQR